MGGGGGGVESFGNGGQTLIINGGDYAFSHNAKSILLYVCFFIQIIFFILCESIRPIKHKIKDILNITD